MKTELSNAMAVAGDKAQYDIRAKRLLAQKSILARILLKTVDAFKGMSPEDVADSIEGEPVIGMVPIEPGSTNAERTDGSVQRIRGFNTENSEINEGMIRFDIVFYVRLPFRFLYKGIIIKHNKTEPTYTKTSLFLCEKRRFLWPGLRKEGNLFKLAGPGGLAFFHLTKKEVSKWPMKK